MIFTF